MTKREALTNAEAELAAATDHINDFDMRYLHVQTAQAYIALAAQLSDEPTMAEWTTNASQ